jgi:hypothetical protein
MGSKVGSWMVRGRAAGSMETGPGVVVPAGWNGGMTVVGVAAALGGGGMAQRVRAKASWVSHRIVAVI